MASTSFLQTFDPFSKTPPTMNSSSSSRSSSMRKGMVRISAVRREAHNQNSRGKNRMVDEGMIVLRKRIHEIKMSDVELPREWMDWEKRVYLCYDAIICDAVGHLQSYLMETRPSLALAMVVLVALSVPTSTAVVLYNLSALFSGIHLG